ncbi:DUF2169 domain-containing protein [Paraburkholderia sp. D15]|uniref:DUF2169 family type VI secretion system accessory protein n=1 Tax=Paraburkholderia sp. D15 TaxID=2880218 RepID=UPI0024783B79|nr:DUF2169 domain-containing protein [Paraburkholderia sp. D15]WGS49449.1 DUF2169 domain-containing protein [Paraburkholderia sp. D15]
MKIIKPTSLGILTRTYRWRGREHLGIAVPVMATLGATPQLAGESALWNTVGEELAGYALDAALPKPHAEFLMSANAYGRYCDEKNACEVGIRFAGVEKRLRVSGAREWRGDSVTPATPFDCLAIDWRHAYGGEGFADNPQGRGFDCRSGSGAGSSDAGGAPNRAHRSLPNIEYPADLLTTRGQTIAPAALTPVEASRPQRRALYGELDRIWQEQDCPGFPRTLDPRYFNVAPLDQQLPTHDSLPDGATYEITRLHPERETIVGVLPALRVRAFVQRRGARALNELAMRPTTAWFIPHRERVVMIFHGAAEIDEFDASDVECLMIAAERVAVARSPAHYQQVFDLRMEPRYGALHALRDGDLMPESLVAPIRNEADAGDDPTQGKWQRNVQRRASRLSDKAHDAMTMAGIAHATSATRTAAARTTGGVTAISNVIGKSSASPQAPKLEGLADFVRQQEQLAADHRARLDNIRQRIERDYALHCPPAPPRCGPPACRAAVEMKAPPMHLEGTPGLPFDPSTFNAMTRDADIKLRETYRQTAHHQDAAPRVTANTAAAQAIRARVVALHAGGASMAGLDLTGADLSGLSLRGAQLNGALLENADLSDVDLSGATLVDALLARADLTRTRLRGANLSRANLSLAQCHDTDFSDATLDGALFDQTHFTRCTLRHASIERAQFRQCSWRTVDFSEATLSDLVFIEQTFQQVDFSRARIRKLAWVQCTAGQVSFFEADIHGFGCIETVAAGIRFDRATVRQACFVKNTVLDHADFSHATLSEVNLRHAQAIAANFSHARISQCDFSDADLRDADLQCARIDNGHLVRTDLSGATLAYADLIGSYLRRADLRGANLNHANLFRANLAQARLDDEAPDGKRTQFNGAYLEQAVFHPLASRP